MSTTMVSVINKCESFEADPRENNHFTLSNVAAAPEPKLPPIKVPKGHHRLQYTYGIWYSRRIPGKGTNSQNLKLLVRFASVEQFWGYFSHILKPNNLASYCSLQIFKDGIKPMLQDSSNRDGGQWVVCLRKSFAPRCWEHLILAMIGEQFMVGDEICGAEVTIMSHKVFISLWNRTSTDAMAITRIKDTLKRVLNLPLSTVFEYKKNIDSLKLA